MCDLGVCVRVCVRETERERVCVSVCVSVCSFKLCIFVNALMPIDLKYLIYTTMRKI